MCKNSVSKSHKDGSDVVDELITSQEEADTRMLLHIIYASSSYRSMVIVTEDTHVFMICLSIFHQISGNMYIRCGTKTNFVTLILAKVGSLLVNRLLKLYKNFMHSLAATHSVLLVVGETSVL